MEIKKTCTTCGVSMPMYMFSYRTDTKKYRGQCKRCHKGYKTTRLERRIRVYELFNLGLKECSLCHEEKAFEFFHKDKSTTTGYASRCKDCISTLNKDEEKKKASFVKRLKSIYNASDIDINDFTSKTECDICGKPFPEINGKHFDHDHETGKYRGALCRDCNIAMGLFYDDINSLENAIVYLLSNK